MLKYDPQECLSKDISSRKMASTQGIAASSFNYRSVASQLRICSFNCRSKKSSIGEIFTLCESHDIVLLHKEHWLLPFELDMLSSIHSDFYGFGTSAVDNSVDVLIGRPIGGTGILYRKQLAHALLLSQRVIVVVLHLHSICVRTCAICKCLYAD